MPGERGRLGPAWFENWRYPPSSANSSTLISYVVVAEKTIFPPHDSPAADASNSGSEQSASNGQQKNAALSSATTISFVLDMPSMIDQVTTSIRSDSDLFGLHAGKDWPYSIVILLITILLIVSSLLSMYVMATSDALKSVINHYLFSLAVTDLLTGLLVTPFALYASLDDSWKRDHERILCKIEAYLEITLYSTNAYVFMWIGVDRFAALRRPSRYEIEQTLTRCKCWIVFTWITSALLCSPTLFGESQARYDHQTFVCIFDWTRMAPYSVTLAVLVLAPSFISVTYSYTYIIRKSFNSDEMDENQRNILDTDPSYIMTFFVILFHFVSWTPWFALKAYESLILKHDLSARPLQFSLLWLAIGGANWKILIYASMSVDFRNRLRRVLINTIKCKCFSRSPRQSIREESDDYIPPLDYTNGQLKTVQVF